VFKRTRTSSNPNWSHSDSVAEMDLLQKLRHLTRSPDHPRLSDPSLEAVSSHKCYREKFQANNSKNLSILTQWCRQRSKDHQRQRSLKSSLCLQPNPVAALVSTSAVPSPHQRFHYFQCRSPSLWPKSVLIRCHQRHLL
jgi:hypothetical protein